MLSRRPCSLGFSTPSALTNLMAFVMLQPKGGVVADSISIMCGGKSLQASLATYYQKKGIPIKESLKMRTGIKAHYVAGW